MDFWAGVPAEKFTDLQWVVGNISGGSVCRGANVFDSTEMTDTKDHTSPRLAMVVIPPALGTASGLNNIFFTVPSSEYDYHLYTDFWEERDRGTQGDYDKKIYHIWRRTPSDKKEEEYGITQEIKGGEKVYGPNVTERNKWVCNVDKGHGQDELLYLIEKERALANKRTQVSLAKPIHDKKWAETQPDANASTRVETQNAARTNEKPGWEYTLQNDGKSVPAALSTEVNRNDIQMKVPDGGDRNSGQKMEKKLRRNDIEEGGKGRDEMVTSNEAKFQNQGSGQAPSKHCRQRSGRHA
ncbi:hypothetical protein K438DRAFT_1775197 [Mycena galopus ATCC 62051]|nr:hypothetical protein K438DRAFT_1775197 [Mycena galopus ATCC 62051]